MDANEVVVNEVESYGVFVILNFLAEPEGEASESTHAHSHGEVRTFNVAGGAMGAVRGAADFGGFHADAFRWAVANRAAAIRPLNLHKLHVVNVVTESVGDGP